MASYEAYDVIGAGPSGLNSPGQASGLKDSGAMTALSKLSRYIFTRACRWFAEYAVWHTPCLAMAALENMKRERNAT